MGRTSTPTYRIEFTGGDLGDRMAWRPKQSGRPSTENIEKYIAEYVRSSGIGGANEHIGRMLGRMMIPPKSARIVRQTGPNAGEVVASWTCPAFWAI